MDAGARQGQRPLLVTAGIPRSQQEENEESGTSAAPESGQPAGGREAPAEQEGVDAGAASPPPGANGEDF